MRVTTALTLCLVPFVASAQLSAPKAPTAPLHEISLTQLIQDPARYIEKRVSVRGYVSPMPDVWRIFLTRDHAAILDIASGIAITGGLSNVCENHYGWAVGRVTDSLGMPTIDLESLTVYPSDAPPGVNCLAE